MKQKFKLGFKKQVESAVNGFEVVGCPDRRREAEADNINPALREGARRTMKPRAAMELDAIISVFMNVAPAAIGPSP